MEEVKKKKKERKAAAEQGVLSLCVHQQGALQRRLYSGSFQHRRTDLQAQEEPEPAAALVFAGCSRWQSWKADCLLGYAARWRSARRLSAEMEFASSPPRVCVASLQVLQLLPAAGERNA